MRRWILWFLLLSGIFLIFDGILSIVFQKDWIWYYQPGRVIRTGIGIILILIWYSERLMRCVGES